MSVSQLSEQLINAGYITEVFTTTANGHQELLVSPGVRTIVDNVPVTYFKRLTGDHSHFSLSLIKSLWYNVKDFDIVHIHAWWNLVSVLSCLVAILRNVPVVVSPRGTLSEYSFSNRNSLAKRIIHIGLGRWLLKNVTVHVTSDREKKTIGKIISHERIVNIFNFVDFPKVIPAQVEPLNTALLKLLFLSRIEEKKGLDILLNALANVSIPYHLTIAGSGNAKYIEGLKRLAADLEISTHISWIGFQGADKFTLIQRHDLMILPSHDENFGNVVIESLSVGTPVLISKNVGLADYVSEKQLGWVCALNQNSISSILGDIFNHRDRLTRIRLVAPEIIKEDFSGKVLTKKYVEMYHKVIHNG
jgi:glycosyltransferase involved in cell wall biosynthesis